MSISRPVRAKRHEVNFVGRLESVSNGDSDAHTLEIDIVDLSSGGAAILTNQHIDAQSTWILRLEPLLCPGFSEAVVIRWCRKDGERFRCGIQFISGAALFLQAGLGLQTAVDGLDIPENEPSKFEAVNTGGTSSVQFIEPATAESFSGVHVRTENKINISGSMIDCHASLGGPIVIGQCLAGGHLSTSDTVQVATLGQPDCTTSLAIGSLPKSNILVARVPKQLDIFEKQIKEAEGELASLSDSEGEMAHSDRERVMELEFKLPDLLEKRSILQGKFDELLNLYKDKINIEVRVEEILYEGVLIECYGRKYQFTRRLIGPLSIACDSNYELTIAIQGQSHENLSDYLKVDHIEQDDDKKTSAA